MARNGSFTHEHNFSSWEGRQPEDVRKWCLRFFTKESTGATHVSLAGGMFKIPPDDRSELYRLMQRDSLGGIPYFICEIRSPVFNYYVDLDYMGTVVLRPTEVLEIVTIIQRATSHFYPSLVQATAATQDNWHRRGTCTTFYCDEPTPCLYQKRPFVKTGVHIVFPNLYVTEEQASALAQWAIQMLTKYRADHPDMAPWASIVDLGVYGDKKGLRLPGSSKCTKCTKCKRMGNWQACSQCSGNGYEITGLGRVYRPLFTILGGSSEPAKTQTTQLCQSLQDALAVATILSEAKTPLSQFEVPNDFIPMDRARIQASKRTSSKDLRSSDPRHKVVEEWIRSLCPEWANLVIQINGLRCYAPTAKGSYSYRVKVMGVGEHYCTNVRRNHTSNTIYFMLYETGISQYCFSKNTPPTPHGVPCTQYRSPPSPVPSIEVLEALFPKAGYSGADVETRYNKLLRNDWASGYGPIVIKRRKRMKERLAVVIPPPNINHHVTGPVSRVDDVSSEEDERPSKKPRAAPDYLDFTMDVRNGPRPSNEEERAENYRQCYAFNL